MEVYNPALLEELDTYVTDYDLEFIKNSYVTEDEVKRITQIIKEFIKGKKLKIYGGMAINEFLPEDHKIYKSKLMPDFDFYSPSPVKHAVELGNILFDKGFPFVEIKSGANEGVYRVYAGFMEVSDFTFVPERMFDIIPSRMIGGLPFVAPEFLKVDLLKAKTNPQHSSYRWEKDFIRSRLVDYFFPTHKPKMCPVLRRNTQAESLKNYIASISIPNSPSLLTGIGAYIFTIRSANLSSETHNSEIWMPQLSYLEVMNPEPLKELKQFKTFFSKEIQKDLDVREYNPFMKWLPRKYMVYYKQELMAIFYDSSEKCIPYNIVEDLKIVSFDFLKLYFHTLYYQAKLINQKLLQNISQCSLYYLDKAKGLYFDQDQNTKTTQLDETPFKQFHIECIGEEYNIIRNHRQRLWSEKDVEFQKRSKFYLAPEKRKFKVMPNSVKAGRLYDYLGEFKQNINI